MKIFHHNDNDGRLAAAIVYLYTKNELKVTLRNNDFIELDHNKNILDANKVTKDEVVYIVDYSITKQTLNLLKEIREKTSHIIWLDHHKSSLEVEDEGKELCEFIELDMNRSGAKIAYDLLVKDKDFDNKYIKEIVFYVDDYDRWIHNSAKSILFNNGSILYNTHPMSVFWLSDPTNVVEQGALIKTFKDIQNTEIVEKNAYEVIINDHKCIVLNTPESSSQAFANYYDRYKFAIRFNFNGYNYQYSIYSNLEDIDCSEIAKSINPKGGGHKGAAGFISDSIEFLPNVKYYFK